MDGPKIVPFRRPKSQHNDTSNLWHQGMRSLLKEHVFHESEAKALFDEEEFRRRYGVIWPRRDREALLDFQRELHLSDQQIRWLTRWNSIKWHDGRIQVTAPMWIRLGGYFQITVLWLILGSQFLLGAHRYGYSSRAMIIASAGWLVLAWISRLIWIQTVFPFKVRERVEWLELQRVAQERGNVEAVRKAELDGQRARLLSK